MVRVLNYVNLDHRILTFQRRLPKRGEIVKRHWFPGYVFVRFDIERDRWQQLARMPGVIEVLGSPTPIGDELFYDLCQRCPDALLENDDETVIPAGSEVEVIEGTFRGQTGVVSASKGKLAWVELIAFNRPTRVELQTKNVIILR